MSATITKTTTPLARFNAWFMASDIAPEHMDACWQAYVEGSWEVEPIENETGPDVRSKNNAA